MVSVRRPQSGALNEKLSSRVVAISQQISRLISVSRDDFSPATFSTPRLDSIEDFNFSESVFFRPTVAVTLKQPSAPQRAVFESMSCQRAKTVQTSETLPLSN